MSGRNVPGAPLFRSIRKHSDVVIADFDISPGDLEILGLAAWGGDRKRPCAELAQQGRVAWQDAHVTVEARNLSGLRLRIQHQFFGRCDLNLKEISHPYYRAQRIRCALAPSTALCRAVPRV